MKPVKALKVWGIFLFVFIGLVALVNTFGPKPSYTPYMDDKSVASQAAAALDTPSPTDTPEVEWAPMTAYDYTVSTNDHTNILCFPSKDALDKVVGEAVNHDKEGAEQDMLAATQLPSGSRVHVIDVEIFHSFAELRVLSDGSECFTNLTQNASVYYHDRSQDSD